jgi:hypothetical protein
VTHSVYSQDQTRLLHHQNNTPAHAGAKSSVLSSSSTSNIAKSANITSYMLKNENDEAMIVTASSIQSPVTFSKTLPTSISASKPPKRGTLNLQSVLEEITNTSRDNRESSRNSSGHFNLLKTSYVPPLSQPIVTTKAQRTTEQINSYKRQSAGSRLNNAKEASQLQLSATTKFLNSTLNRETEELNIRYITDIDSIR